MKKQNFNIVIVGVGGQGLITLTKILAEAAKDEGYDIRTSELHGLSQRGGSVETLIRFGKKVWSPLVIQGGADLIIALEVQESLKSCYYASEEKTIFLVNDYFKSIPGKELLQKEAVLKELEKFSKETILMPASNIAKEKIGKEVLSGVLLVSSSAFQKLIPLKPESILKSIKKIIPEKYLEMNMKAFNLAEII
ncbi:MAG: indolepyruvate oxidoreductase subunit beta [Patescibacteria group bacterium]